MGCGTEDKSCCCSNTSELTGGVDYIVDWYETPNGKVGQVSTALTPKDKWGAVKARFTFGRMNYKVMPGLYAVGCPDKHSDVLVSANYKLSFDTLRNHLKGKRVWILVLDTKGINVWCAAGKGTFGTQELIKAITLTELSSQVDHGRVIVPQLGAVGVSAHEVKKATGFNVEYGPVRATDIDAYLAAGRVATPEMRHVQFTLYDRFVLTPTELVNGWRYFVGILLFFLLLAGFSKNGFGLELWKSVSSRAIVNLSTAYIAGMVMGPILLPVLFFRSFAAKGALLGVICVVLLGLLGFLGQTVLEVIAWSAIVIAISSFAVMNFTGSSTYTSLSGVVKEMKIAVPLQLGFSIIGVTLWLVSKFI